MIPVIDVFAGPGGLSEGFSAPIDGESRFDVRISVELTRVACRTLATRAFYREFRNAGKPIPKAYYRHLRGEISQEELFKQFPKEAEEAEKRVCQAELGTKRGNETVARQLPPESLSDAVLIGGPPCQAYSLVGRSRSLGAAEHSEDPDAARSKFYSDVRHTLYKQYLRIIREYRPAIFVMENVLGILSAKLNGEEPVFDLIRHDLTEALGRRNSYELYSFRYETPVGVTGEAKKFLLKCEEFGVPQRRHRVIVFGLRKDVAEAIGHKLPTILKPRKKPVTLRDVIGSMPPLKSSFSRRGLAQAFPEGRPNWFDFLDRIDLSSLADIDLMYCSALQDMKEGREKLRKYRFNAKRATTPEISNQELNDWYQPINKGKIPCVNHESRAHMYSDLRRYCYISFYTALMGHSPRLDELPEELLPHHRNVIRTGDTSQQAFADRFKAQAWDRPSTTVTCHIAKDGNYFIHPDPAQCRSLSVREAARLQTFPDDYFFEGNRTEQYHQVGNAVPSFLAHQLAEIVYEVYGIWQKTKK